GRCGPPGTPGPGGGRTPGARRGGGDETAASTWNLLTRKTGTASRNAGHGRARGGGPANSGSVGDHVGSRVDDGRGRLGRRLPAAPGAADRLTSPLGG